MRNTKAAGDRGEAEAARYLRQRGSAILDTQWRCRLGELDLVARDRDGTVCFVEVKLLSWGLSPLAASLGLPREAVDRRKQERLRKAALLWLAERDCASPARFDVAEVYEDRDGGLQVVYLEDAFQ